MANDKESGNPWLGVDAQVHMSTLRKKFKPWTPRYTKPVMTETLLALEIVEALRQLCVSPIETRRVTTKGDVFEFPTTTNTTEHAVLKNAETSARTADWIFHFIRLGDVRGKDILEICSGASDTSMELRKQGARVVAIDYRYKDIHEFAWAVQAHLDQRYRDRTIDTVKHAKKATRFNEEFGHLVRMREITEEDKKNSEKAYETELQTAVTFLLDIPTSGRQNVAALSGHLPAKDNAFDGAFSFAGISSTQIDRPATFVDSSKEALRALKPERLLHIAPFAPDGSNLLPLDPGGVNQRRILKILQDEGIPYQFIPILNEAGTLVLYKVK